MMLLDLAVVVGVHGDHVRQLEKAEPVEEDEDPLYQLSLHLTKDECLCCTAYKR